jgi:hypothetical protein
MTKIVMAVLICAAWSTALATSQVPEALVYGGATNDLYTTPLESLFPAGSPKVFVERPSSTACWRGYVGTWKIENDELYLVALQEGHPRTGAIPLHKVNPQWKSPVKATWFSGTLRIGRGKVLMGGMGFSEKRETDIFLEIREGKVVSTRQVDNTREKAAAEPESGPVRK